MKEGDTGSERIRGDGGRMSLLRKNPRTSLRSKFMSSFFLYDPNLLVDRLIH